MKKVFIIFIILMNFSAFAAGNKTMYVSVSSAIIRESASKTSKKSTTIPYGSAVSVLQEKKGWSYISCDNPKAVGWVQTSSLTRKNVKAQGKVSSADAKEIALAGKGFNASLESAFAEQSNVDFSFVDKIETYTPSVEAVIKFIKEGKLHLDEEE